MPAARCVRVSGASNDACYTQRDTDRKRARGVVNVISGRWPAECYGALGRPHCARCPSLRVTPPSSPFGAPLRCPPVYRFWLFLRPRCRCCLCCCCRRRCGDYARGVRATAPWRARAPGRGASPRFAWLCVPATFIPSLPPSSSFTFFLDIRSFPPFFFHFCSALLLLCWLRL